MCQLVPSRAPLRPELFSAGWTPDKAATWSTSSKRRQGGLTGGVLEELAELREADLDQTANALARLELGPRPAGCRNEPPLGLRRRPVLPERAVGRALPTPPVCAHRRGPTWCAGDGSWRSTWPPADSPPPPGPRVAEGDWPAAASSGHWTPSPPAPPCPGSAASGPAPQNRSGYCGSGASFARLAAGPSGRPQPHAGTPLHRCRPQRSWQLPPGCSTPGGPRLYMACVP